MPQLPEPLQTLIETLRDYHRPSDLLDVLLIALVIFCALLWLKGSTGMSLVKGAAIVIVTAIALGALFHLRVVSWILQNSVPALLVGVPIVFQPEIRRGLERLGRTRVAARRSNHASDQVLDVLAQAALEMAHTRTGALIVVERATGLDDYLRTGTALDALPSVPLLINVFWRNSPLHDGAMILRENRVAAAACTLPLSEAELDGHYGTRHRAALGLSERTDAVVLVVSEETGAITIAVNGTFMTGLDRDNLRPTLASLLQREEPGVVTRPSLPLVFRHGEIFRRLPDGSVAETPLDTLDPESATTDSFAARPDDEEPVEAPSRGGSRRV